MEFINESDFKPRIGVIYEIFLKSNPSINYVGSTLGATHIKSVEAVFNQRKINHKRNYNKWKKGIEYSEKNILFNAYDIYGFDNFNHYILASFTVLNTPLDTQFIRSNEEYYRQKIRPTLNTASASGLDIEKKKLYDKQYRQEHKKNKRHNKQLNYCH